MQNITKPTPAPTTNHLNTEKNVGGNKFVEAIHKALLGVPPQNILDSLIRIKEITKKYKNLN